jgi:maleate cis-trans isomerase
MIGWRAKIGHVAPSRGDTFVYEFYRILGDGFLLLNTTGTIRRLVDDHLERQLKGIEEATVDLAETGAEFIIIGGSPLFTRLGHGSDREIAARLEAKVGVPVAAGMTCEVEALKHMGIRKVVVATPYPEELTKRAADFLTASGFEVLRAEGLGIELNSELGNQPDHAAYKIAKKVYLSAPEADGIFLPCNRWPTVSVISLLERETGKPALSSTLCNIWYALYRLHIKEEIPGYGKLLASLGGGVGDSLSVAGGLLL